MGREVAWCVVMTAAHVVCVLLPLRIESTANLREHWTARARRASTHRITARVQLMAAHRNKPDLPVTIALTRIAPRQLDGDNLQSAFKATRDGVADWLGRPDNHPSLTWVYAQRKGKPGQYAAEVMASWPA